MIFFEDAFVPPRQGNGHVVRSELLAGLCDLAPTRKLALLTAGAGFGKTTLLAQWRQILVAKGANVGWLSLRAGDAQPDRFYALLLAALRPVVPGTGAGEQGQRNGSAMEEIRAAVLIQTLARVPGKLFLMIDGMEHVISHPANHALMQSIADASLPALHIVAASRRPLGMRLGRLRARGDVVDLDSKDLAFSPAETLAFLRLRLHAGIGLDTATRLHEFSAGWPAGLQLLAASLKASPRQPQQLLAQTNDLDAYLSEDVVQGVPDELLEFMQALSILPGFNTSLAACVGNRDQAARLLAEIEARGLPLQTTEEEGDQPLYRFHPMFARFLQRGLSRGNTGNTVRIADLHRRAMQWFANHGRFGDAVLHALQADDFAAVPPLVEAAISDPPSLTQLRDVHRWLDMLPQQRLAMHPRLLLLAGWACVVTTRPDQAESWVATLETARPGATRSWHGRLLCAAIAVQRDQSEVAMALLQTMGSDPNGQPVAECVRLGLTARCFATQGLYADANAAIAQIHAVVAREQSASATELGAMAAAQAASVLLLQGDALQAERLAAEALAGAESRHGRRSVSASFSACVMAQALYERDRADEARSLLADRLDVLALSVPDAAIGAALCHARLLTLSGEPHEALAYLSAMETSFHRRGLTRGLACMLAQRQRIALAAGDTRHAAGLLAELDALAGTVTDACQQAEVAMVAAISRVRLNLAMAKPEGAIHAVSALHDAARALRRERLMVAADLLQAQMLDAMGKDEAAMACLESALATSYRLGLVRTVLDEGEPIRRLLVCLPVRPNAAQQAYLERLLAQPAASSPACAKCIAAAVAPYRPARGSAGSAVLTRREREVLDLVSQAMSNKRIALVLNISELTVKWNLKQIFAKLGVSRRYDAIVAARTLERDAG